MEDEKLSGRVIIDAILDNMRQQVEELRYSKVVPAAYDVYLHADDQQRFESLAHEMAAEAVRALQEKLDALNGPSRLDRVRGMVGRPRLPFKKVGPWLVRITRDPDGVVPRGRALVVSQIALPGAESFEGQRTRRLATLSEPSPEAGPKASEAALDRLSRFVAETQGGSKVGAPAPHAAAPRPGTGALSPAALDESSAQTADTHSLPRQALATLTWKDDAGAHRHLMTGVEMTVGRAAQGSTADVLLATVPDVSRLHLRIRHHPEEGRFSIEDLSLLGTTLNGRSLERGTPRDLPSGADIQLADAITLHFESEAFT